MYDQVNGSFVDNLPDFLADPFIPDHTGLYHHLLNHVVQPGESSGSFVEAFTNCFS